MPLLYSRLNVTPVLTTLDVSGGVAPYGYAVAPAAVFDVSDRGVFEVGTGQATAGDVTATVSVSDAARGRVAVAVLVTVRFADIGELGFDENPVTVAVGHDYTGVVYEVAASGGSGEYVYAVARTVDDRARNLGLAIDEAGALNLANALVATSTISVGGAGDGWGCVVAGAGVDDGGCADGGDGGVGGD